MRQVSYAGGRFVTTDEIADALLHLVVGIASTGVPQLVEVPIVVVGAGQDVAWMTVGPSSSILSMPFSWIDEVPDFSDQVTMMRMQASYPRSTSITAGSPSQAWESTRAAPWDDDDYYGL